MFVNLTFRISELHPPPTLQKKRDLQPTSSSTFVTLRGTFIQAQSVLFLRGNCFLFLFSLRTLQPNLNISLLSKQISKILIFVKRKCHLSTSQMLCVNSAAECESARLKQLNLVIQNLPNFPALEYYNSSKMSVNREF